MLAKTLRLQDNKAHDTHPSFKGDEDGYKMKNESSFENVVSPCHAQSDQFKNVLKRIGYDKHRCILNHIDVSNI